MRANFGLSGMTYAQGDFNYDGTVNLTDFNLLAGKFGVSVAPEAPARPIRQTRVLEMLADQLA